MTNTEGERYTFTDEDKTVLHKVDAKGKPDFDGWSWKVLSGLQDTYMAYQIQSDSTQPSAVVVIPKQCVIE